MMETAFATAYELHDLANGHIANSSDDINRLLALFTAYLITAYRAGASGFGIWRRVAVEKEFTL